VPHAALAQVAGAALARLHRRRAVAAVAGSLGGRRQGLGQLRSPPDGGVQGVTGRVQGVEHRLVAGLGLAPLLHAGDPGPQRSGEGGGVGQVPSTAPAIRRNSVP
jgi:hypothetical protein